VTTPLAQATGILVRFQTILTTTGSVVGTTVVNSAFGFVYWWAAIRIFSPESTGLAVAALSAMALLGRLAVMGLGTAIVGVLPRYDGNRSGLILAAFVLSAASAVILGAGFSLLAPLLFPTFSPLSAGLFAVALFTSGVVLTTMGTVLDTVLIGLLHGWLQLLRNVIFASVKLGLVFVAVGWFGDSEATVYGTWVAGELISLLLVGALVVRLGHVVTMPSPEWGSIFGLGRNAMGHHVLNLARVAPALVIPVLVAGLLSPETNSEFYVTLLLGSSLQIVAAASTFTLYAVANQSPEKLHHQVRFTLGLSAAGVSLGVVLLWLGGEILLSLFGFSSTGAEQWLLLLIGLAAYPMIVKDHWVALLRLRQDVRWAASVMTAGAVVEVLFAAAGALLGGLLGLAAAWLIAQLLQAALMTNRVYHAAALSTLWRPDRSDASG
jgi:O-antigen/teichoic acid export membrane protein